MTDTDVKHYLEALDEYCADTGSKMRLRYSGRGMYGKECVGVVTDDPTGCIEAVSAASGLTGSRQDSMGTRSIVYWPNLQAPEGYQPKWSDHD